MNEQYKVILMGPQGSGKGTQAELLREKLNVPALSMGQLLRDEIAAGTAIGKEAEAILNAGDLVSDEMAANVLKARLDREDAAGGYILDGYPRNMSQFAAFDFDVPTHVLVIKIPDSEALKRLGGRLTCEECGKVYAEADGHKEGDACECGGEMHRRPDDTPEAISRRLNIYHNETTPVIEEYKKQGLVHKIDGMGGVLDVHRRIVSALELDEEPKK